MGCNLASKSTAQLSELQQKRLKKQRDLSLQNLKKTRSDSLLSTGTTGRCSRTKKYHSSEFATISVGIWVQLSELQQDTEK